MLSLQHIDKTWSLFLDRDGVINEEKDMDYINTWEEFAFYEGALEAIKIFGQKFGRIVIVTNQRGIAKGVTKFHELDRIHENLLKEIILAEGRIDRIYYCGDLEDGSPDRKPNPGMGLKAQQDFPDINVSKSIMIGNTLSDMQFGRNLGVALNVFVTTTRPDVIIPNPLIDLAFPNLLSVARAL